MYRATMTVGGGGAAPQLRSASTVQPPPSEDRTASGISLHGLGSSDGVVLGAIFEDEARNPAAASIRAAAVAAGSSDGTTITCAVKRLLPANICAENAARFRKELELMVRLGRHTNVVSLLGFTLEQICIVLDYAERGTLDGALRRRVAAVLACTVSRLS